MKFNFKKIIKALNPEPLIGGLEVSESAVRYVLLNADKTVARYALQPLGENVVQGGLVKDAAAFEIACRALHAQVARRREQVPVILTLTPALVYAQVFSLPFLPAERLEEAARLNLRMISPIDFDTAYADWQIVSMGDEGGVNNQNEALGAFIEAKVADAYREAARRAEFLVAAIEFAPLSLARVIQEDADLDAREPSVVIGVGAHGIMFLVVRKGNVYFTRFLEWSAVGDASVTVSHFQSVVGLEMRRLLNFYTNKWGGAIQKAFVVNATSNKELAEWIKKEFSLEVLVLAGYHLMDRTWLIAVGAAIRGLIPRADDRYISLTRVGTEDAVVENRVRRFIALWRTVVFVVMTVSVVTFAFADLMLVRVERSVRLETEQMRDFVGVEDAASFSAQAENFNALVDKVFRAQGEARQWSGVLGQVYAAARGTDAALFNMQLDAAKNIVVINGEAPNEQGVIAFKNALADNPRITAVDLPLSSITQIMSGRAAFTATITVK